MNTKGTQQVTVSDDYKSLYEYLGKSTKGTDLPGLVLKAARYEGVEIRFKQLTETQTAKEYAGVYSYPTWFLDKYFEVNDIKLRDHAKAYVDIMTKVAAIEERVLSTGVLLAKLASKLNVDLVEKQDEYIDDLPF
jgi:hypothetical protein